MISIHMYLEPRFEKPLNNHVNTRGGTTYLSNDISHEDTLYDSGIVISVWKDTNYLSNIWNYKMKLYTIWYVMQNLEDWMSKIQSESSFVVVVIASMGNAYWCRK